MISRGPVGCSCLVHFSRNHESIRILIIKAEEVNPVKSHLGLNPFRWELERSSAGLKERKKEIEILVYET